MLFYCLWQIEKLKHSLPAIEELHLMGNNISTIEVHYIPFYDAVEFVQIVVLNKVTRSYFGYY